MARTDRNLQQTVNAFAQSRPDRTMVRAGDLEVDLAGYQARFRGRRLSLSTSQLEVLAILAASRRICSRVELSEALGLYGARTVDMILSRLRREVGHDFIRNVHGLGWIIDASTLERDHERD